MKRNCHNGSPKAEKEGDLQGEWIQVNFGCEKARNPPLRLGKMSPHKGREFRCECGLQNSRHQLPLVPQRWLSLQQSIKKHDLQKGTVE